MFKKKEDEEAGDAAEGEEQEQDSGSKGEDADEKGGV